jgi:hypothetical protein
MAFNAGSIEGTLTLNRTAFTEGLRRAKADAEKFARQKFEVNITPKLDRTALARIKADIEKVTGNVKVKVSLDNASLQAVKQRIDRTVGNVKVKVGIDTTSRAALQAQLDKLKATINVVLKVSAAEKARIKAEIERISPTINIRLRYDRSQIDELIRRLRDADTGVRNLGNSSDQSFGRMRGGIQAVLALLPLLLPVAASAINGIVGLVGGAISILGVFGAAFGAVAIVAVPLFKKIQDGAAKSRAEIAKLPPGIREGAGALKDLTDQVEKLGKATQLHVGVAFAAAFHAAQEAVKPLAPLINTTSMALEKGFQSFSLFFKGPEYKQFLSFLTDNITPATQKLFSIIESTVKVVMNLVQAFWPLGSWLLDKINVGLQNLAKWTGTLKDDPKFKQWLEGVRTSLELWWNLLTEVGKFLWQLVQDLKPLGDKLVKFLTDLFAALNKLPPGFIGAITMALASFFAVILAAGTGPWGLIIAGIAGIVGGLAALYDNNEKVHKSLDAFVTWLKGEWQPLWDKIQENFNKYILPAWDKLVQTAQDNLPRAFAAVKTAYETSIKPTLEPLIESLTGPDGLIPAFLDFANTVLPHFVTALSGAITDAGTIIGGLITMLTGVLTTMSGAFTTFSGLFSGDWDKMWRGIDTMSRGFLTTIAGATGTTYDDIIKKGQDFERTMDTWWAGMWGGMITQQDGSQTTIKGSWATFGSEFETAANTWGTRISNWWAGMWGGMVSDQNGQETIIKGSWATFGQEFETAAGVWGTRISGWWNGLWNGISTFFSGLLTTMQGHFNEFGNWFQTRAGEVAAGIGAAWRAVANFFKDPINWVINVVLNNGIIGAWNTVMGWIGQPALKAAPIANIPGYAEGGSVRGPGTGTSDSIPALLSAGEFVVNARYAKQHEHFLAALNAGQAEAVQAAGGGNDPSPYPRYQAGGPVDAGLNFARAQTGKPYVWGGVGPGGYDCSGFMSAIANVLLGRNPYSRIGTTDSAPWAGWNPNLTSQFGVGFFHGNPGHMAGTLGGTNVESGSGHGPMTGGVALGAMSRQFGGHMSLPQAGGAFVGGGAGLVQQIVSWWSQVGGKATSLFNGLLNFTGMPGLGSVIGNGITGIPTAIVKTALSALQTKLEHLFTTITVAGTPSAAGGAAGASVTAAVKAVADRYGWGTGVQWNDLSMLIQRESGWDPNAANPRSSARGLFQKMTSVHGPVEPTPGGQAEWGLNYIKSRYGNPAGAWDHELKFGWYDRGGMLGQGVSPINTGTHAERVLSPQQTDDFHTLVAMLRDLVSPGGLSGGDTYHVMLPAGASVRELANEIDFRKRISDKGRYRPR